MINDNFHPLITQLSERRLSNKEISELAVHMKALNDVEFVDHWKKMSNPKFSTDEKLLQNVVDLYQSLDPNQVVTAIKNVIKNY